MSPLDSTRAPALSRRGLRLTGIIALVVSALIVGEGLISRAESQNRLREWTDAQAIQTVAVAPPTSGSAASTLTLPGRLQAYINAPIYARVSGYLKSWKLDIGAPVKAGQLLALIDTPDLDQQLLQARADLASAQANEALAATTAKRWRSMRGSRAVAQQDIDEKVGDLAAKQALVNAARANVDRLEAMEGFKRLVAPFGGVVTARNTDIGQLINAGSGQELFVVADVHKLRVYVSVPQNYVPSVPVGTRAVITVPEHTDKTYSAVVDSSAQAVNAASGTTLMQLAVDNKARELMPGDYAQVTLQLPQKAALLSIPASALIFDAQGLQVATVDAANHIVLKRVTVAQDLGKTIQINSGLLPDDRVVQSPPDGIADGTLVRVAGNADKALAADGARTGKNERG
jgi:RND family efflux transporter MFP subunit